MTELKPRFLAGGILALIIVVSLIGVVLFSGPPVRPADAVPPSSSPDASAIPSEEPSVPPAITKTKTPVPTQAPPTLTPSLTPTPLVLEGRVNSESVSCRYGPGPYVENGVLTRNDRVRVLGRDVSGQWLLVNFESEAGEARSCWVESRPMDLAGADPAALENYYPGKYTLPLWEDYQPPANVRTSRLENFVDIRWDDANLLELTQRESSRSPRFILEAWVCRDGVLGFIILGVVDNTSLIVEDQPGCTVPSSGLLYSAGKQGYSDPVNLLWPAP